MTEKIAVITGATSGIGRSCATLFARNAYRVIAVGRNETELDSLSAGASTIETRTTDLNDVEQVDSLIDDLGRSFDHIDVLVNAAGVIGNGSIENTSLDEWDAMMLSNLRSVFYLMQRAIPLLEKSRGNIVNVSSVTGTRAFPNVLAYCVSKAGIDQLTRCSALELAPKGIRVNAVNPGVVVTNLHKRSGMSEDNYATFLEHSKTTHPLGRVGNPDEIAELIFYLASEKAGWITGATYEIDGGRALTCAR